MSSVHATLQVRMHDSPQRAQSSSAPVFSSLHRALGDRATYAYFTNVRFSCDMDTLRVAVSELMLYKSMHEPDDEIKERFRSAAEFIRRGK
jgi:hypothetical protein